MNLEDVKIARGSEMKNWETKSQEDKEINVDEKETGLEAENLAEEEVVHWMSGRKRRPISTFNEYVQ